MKNEDTKSVMTRRKALGRLGVFAAVAYAVPAVTTLSMAHAGSGASAASSGGSAASAGSTASEASAGSVASEASVASTPSGVDPATTCGPEDLNDPEYVACLTENGFKVPGA